MTTLIEDLQAVLNPLVAGGCWYQVNTAQPPVFPYIVFLDVVSSTNVTFKGPSDLQNSRIQIDVYSPTASATINAAKAIDAAMQASALNNVPISSQGFYESDVKLFRQLREYSVWSTN